MKNLGNSFAVKNEKIKKKIKKNNNTEKTRAKKNGREGGKTNVNDRMSQYLCKDNTNWQTISLRLLDCSAHKLMADNQVNTMRL